MVKARIDMAKFRRDLEKEMSKFAKEGVQTLPTVDRRAIGLDVIEEMQDQISKGISPIQGRGRFPAYTAVGKALKVKNRAKGFGKNLRKAARIKAAKITKQGYPYSVRGKFPSKRERPVNLYLSGTFLTRWLEARFSSRGVTIGFWNQKAVAMEDGHRVGWNNQGERPIIPINDETFTRTIYDRVLQSVRFRMIGWLEEYSKRRK